MATLHVIAGASDTPARMVVRRIEIADLIDALRLGWEDFKDIPSHAVFLCLIYPLVGFFIGGLMLGYNLLPLLFPVSAGFALIGPFAALGIYELSRRREAGLEVHWSHAFDVLRSPSIGSIGAVSTVKTWWRRSSARWCSALIAPSDRPSTSAVSPLDRPAK